MRTLVRGQSTKRSSTGMTIVRAVPIVRQEDMTCFLVGMEFLVDRPTLGHGMRLAFPYAHLLEMDEQAFRDALKRVPEQIATSTPETPKPLNTRSSYYKQKEKV